MRSRAWRHLERLERPVSYAGDLFSWPLLFLKHFVQEDMNQIHCDG
ncbi:MAG: hypothetical protein N0E58_04740 [Candidatus Thiodiazotropha endolucinida]|nr:hypothetical protein [Candidatus Thiodiazotropha endolucinida]